MRAEFQVDAARGLVLGAHTAALARVTFTTSLGAAFFVAICGCVTTTHVGGESTSPSTRLPTSVAGGKPTVAPTNDGSISGGEAVDPSEMCLQNIESAFLLYYSINRALPPRLEDLISLSSDDLPLMCPASDREYIYIKDGLSMPGNSHQIIVCDPTPARDGKRWCIVMAPPKPGAALELEPQHLPESIFRNLQPSQ